MRPVPKHSFITKTICSVFQNLGIGCEYLNIKEIAYGIREPKTEEEELANQLATFVAINLVNRNRPASSSLRFFRDRFRGRDGKALDRIGAAENECAGELRYAALLLIEAYRRRKKPLLAGLLIVASQFAAYRHSKEFFVYPPSFLGDWRKMLKDGSEGCLSEIIQAKIILCNGAYKKPSKELDPSSLRGSFARLSPKLAELNALSVSIFGSCCGGLQTSESDVDYLVAMKPEASMDERDELERAIRENTFDLFRRDSDVMFEGSVPAWATLEAKRCILIWEAPDETTVQ